MKAKQEIIYEAFIKLIGEDKFNLIKAHIQEDGWCVMFDEDSNKITPTFKELGLQYDLSLSDTDRISNIGGTLWRPKYLAGIETNNGWIEISKEIDLPLQKVWLTDGNSMWQGKLFLYGGCAVRINTLATHFQFIIKPLPLIYQTTI